MSDYTTTQSDIEDAYAKAVEHLGVDGREDVRAWLAEHDAKVRAEALREAAKELEKKSIVIHFDGPPSMESSWWSGITSARKSFIVDLRACAARIEREAGLK